MHYYQRSFLCIIISIFAAANIHAAGSPTPDTSSSSSSTYYASIARHDLAALARPHSAPTNIIASRKPIAPPEKSPHVRYNALAQLMSWRTITSPAPQRILLNPLAAPYREKPQHVAHIPHAVPTHAIPTRPASAPPVLMHAIKKDDVFVHPKFFTYMKDRFSAGKFISLIHPDMLRNNNQDTILAYLESLPHHFSPADCSQIWQCIIQLLLSSYDNITYTGAITIYIQNFIDALNQYHWGIPRSRIFNNACKEWCHAIQKKYTRNNPATGELHYFPTSVEHKELLYWEKHIDQIKTKVNAG